jgi:hypothetical protein
MELDFAESLFPPTLVAGQQLLTTGFAVCFEQQDAVLATSAGASSVTIA